MAIPIRSPREVDAIGVAADALGEILAEVRAACVPGATGIELDALAALLIQDAGAQPLFKGVVGRVGVPPFPGVSCICINEQVVHGVPSGRPIREGDLVTIDIGLTLGGWCADMAASVMVGECSLQNTRLAHAADKAAELATGLIAPGVRWSGVARAMREIASEAGLGVVPGYIGHGIGRSLHEPPRLPLLSVTGGDLEGTDEDLVFRPGMVVSVEPTFALGDPRVRTLDDGWTVVTADGAPACHEERMLAVTAEGCRVLGARPGGGA
ncbi:MAG: type I methionyl aminopeptidase [Phycisphaerales bacterium]|nr:type I methionyl aminopeptidase [Phycisphaerales bacterium]